jgi:hypothetical protein
MSSPRSRCPTTNHVRRTDIAEVKVLAVRDVVHDVDFGVVASVSSGVLGVPPLVGYHEGGSENEDDHELFAWREL